MKLTHIDLFSGIGGFALAAQCAGFKTEVFCEKDEFCQEVLKARFGAAADAEDERLQVLGAGGEQKSRTHEQAGLSLCDSARPVLIPDIRALDGRRFAGTTLLTGGFPCQPFSCAGKRKGKADDRYLWPEMLRVISEARPAWVLGENVAGIINMELEQVCSDLEGEGYEVQPIVIPACAVNAPHRRDRVWIIGRRKQCENYGQNGNGYSKNVAVEVIMHGQENMPKLVQDFINSTDAPRSSKPRCNVRQGQEQFGRSLWGKNWPEVAARLCRVDDGVPVELDGFKLSKTGHRAARLKALGNAIVPQVAGEIIRQIALLS